MAGLSFENGIFLCRCFLSQVSLLSHVQELLLRRVARLGFVLRFRYFVAQLSSLSGEGEENLLRFLGLGK